MSTIAGKYNILQELGEGSSGTVYLVEHSDLGVKFALKLLSRGLSTDDRIIGRFKREAETLLKFTHPGSVQMRDFGKTEDGRYYMAMDYCEGIPLKRLLEREGHLPVMSVLKIIEQLLAVLEAAHGIGIIHRDIKPENIMIVNFGTDHESIKILDFGVAKLKETALLNVTLEGASIGTPYYMSPEQAAGEINFDHRVDIYSTGILAYELLAGHPPFQADTIVKTLLMHITQQAKPLPSELHIPTFVSDMIFKAIQKNPAQRYSTASEFRVACERAVELQKKHEQQEQEVFMPVSAAASHEQPEADGGSESMRAAPASTQQFKILCLDDDEMILNIMKHMLEKNGYKVFTANNCAAIHSYLFNEGVDMLLSDVQMPDMYGTRVCALLKKTVKNLKILLFSNLDERELDKMSKECKADGWISKRAKPDYWIREIQSALGDR